MTKYPAWKVTYGPEGATSLHCVECGNTLLLVPNEAPHFEGTLKCERGHSRIRYRFLYKGPSVDPEVEVLPDQTEPVTDEILEILDETARQIVLGARQERDKAVKSYESVVNTNRLLQRHIDTERAQKIEANTKVWRLEEELKALRERCDGLLGGPDSQRAQQIAEHMERLRIAAQGLAEQTVDLRTTFIHLTEMYGGLPSYGPFNPDNYDHAFAHCWRHVEDEPDPPPVEPIRGGSMKKAMEEASGGDHR